jgi:uncharacterized protein
MLDKSDWSLAKAVCRDAFKTSFHFSIASVNSAGYPHVTPIGSLMLGDWVDGTGQAIYFERFTRQLPAHASANPNICVLAVNSGRWFWLKSLLAGRFTQPPALRLFGTMGQIRPATEIELQRWRKRVAITQATKGHQLMWQGMSDVREITITRIESVNLGKMTANCLINS